MEQIRGLLGRFVGLLHNTGVAEGGVMPNRKTFTG